MVVMGFVYVCMYGSDVVWLKVAADGNWIHIHYQSKLQAKKVLSKNGKVFGGSIMVGVAPCIDKVGTSSNGQLSRICNNLYVF